MKAKIAGVEYNLVKRPNLPKRGSGKISVQINGNPEVAVITSNKGWNTDPDYILEYIWLPFDGVAYFLTLDYAVAATTLAGEEIEIVEGKAARPDPKRVTNKTETEAGRIAKFKVTFAARA